MPIPWVILCWDCILRKWPYPEFGIRANYIMYYNIIILYHNRLVLDKTLNCLDRGGRCGVAGDSAHLHPRISRPTSIMIWLSLSQAKGCSKLLHRGVSALGMASWWSLSYRAAGKRSDVTRSSIFPMWFLMRSSDDEFLFLYSTRWLRCPWDRLSSSGFLLFVFI